MKKTLTETVKDLLLEPFNPYVTIYHYPVEIMKNIDTIKEELRHRNHNAVLSSLDNALVNIMALAMQSAVQLPKTVENRRTYDSDDLVKSVTKLMAEFNDRWRIKIMKSDDSWQRFYDEHVVSEHRLISNLYIQINNFYENGLHYNSNTIEKRWSDESSIVKTIFAKPLDN